MTDPFLEHCRCREGTPSQQAWPTPNMEFLEAIAEGMPTRCAAAIAQIPFETVRNWMSKNDPAFRPDFFQAFERARAMAVYKSVKKLRDSKDWKAHAFWLSKNTTEFADKKEAVSESNVTNNTIVMDAKTTKALSDAYDRSRAEREADKAMREANGNGGEG